MVKDLNNKSITKEAQVRIREASCGSSVDQTDELMRTVPRSGMSGANQGGVRSGGLRASGYSV
jgi:hypothetical protein